MKDGYSSVKALLQNTSMVRHELDAGLQGVGKNIHQLVILCKTYGRG
ncbi:hypothetical protein MC7420_2338 [Coleofasciculus chthonoplastes PCC 7420]|uniref:Uncharacterized protein n=1 Tax=Coleofasciculus chthonoplastes PCC 7420 TaxID=118168 RepID=B4W2C7_9CYAN|nr:hypothetical protein MC7420_2338 [Coleofasciculus chthonoplastes PCC 7420]